MGRKSRRKRERRGLGVGPIARTARGKSLESLLGLLEASSASPTACHRLASLALIFCSVMKRTRAGSQQISPALLPQLVRAASRENRDLWCREDFVPHDPRLEVLVRWRGELHRLLPGSLDQPGAVVDNLRSLSGVIDPVLVDRLGFGVSDAVELVLRRVGHVASMLAPTWSIREASARARPRIGESELAAALRLSDIEQQVESCQYPERARRALEFLSVCPKGLIFDSGGGGACFGAVIAVRTGSGQCIPIPSGVLVDSLSELGGLLADQACQLAAGVEQQWQEEMERGVAYMLAGSGHPVYGPVRTDEEGPAHWAVVYSPSQVLVVDVVAGLRHSSLVQRAEASNRSLDRVAQGAGLITIEGTMRLSPEVEMVTLQVGAYPDMAASIPSGDHPHLPMRGFRWMVRTSSRRREDLWYFLRDIAAWEERTRLFANDFFDIWEMWRTGGRHVPVAARATRGFFVLDGSDAPWTSAGKDAAVERALLTLGFPQVSAWPTFENVGDYAYVSDLNLGLTYRVLPWSVPVAILMIDAQNPLAPWCRGLPTPAREEDSDTVWYLATGIVERLADMKEAFHAAAEASELSSLEIVLAKEPVSLNRVPSIATSDGPIVCLEWNDRIAEAMFFDPVRLWTVIGRELAEPFQSSAARESFLAGWDAAPPRVRADASPFAHQVLRLPDPEKSHSSEIAAVIHRLGKHMVAQSVSSGSYEGDQAKKLENEVIYPWALEELHRTIAPYSADQLLLLAMVQLERANHRRLMGQQQLARRRGFPAQPPDTSSVDYLEDELEDAAQLAKAIGLILEEALAEPPAGNNQPDRRSWNAILPIAEVAYASCLRSERLHCHLERAGIVITDPFDIHIKTSGHPTDVDMTTYQQIQKAEARPEPVPIDESPSPSTDPILYDSRPLRERHPELADIDNALRLDHGFGLDALIGVLECAWSWNVTSEAPVGTSTLEHFTDSAISQIPGVTRDECSHATEWLTLRTSNLTASPREYWKTDLRATRIDTRPFVSYDSSLYVLPWTSATTLAILSNYLGDGRLPWPQETLRKNVVQSLNRYRQGKNDQLEKDCYEELADTPLTIRRNIKPGRSAQMIGIDQLSGEVDLLAVDANQSRIWVIEVKDPYIPMSMRQIRSSISRFHGPGEHVDKLLQKREDIKRNITHLTSALSVDDHAYHEWTVEPLMTTRHVHPAAFSVDSKVRFCQINTLREAILGDG